VLAHAIDTAGNTSASSSMTVTLDTVKPSTLTFTPTGDALVNKAEQTAQAYTVAFTTAEPNTTSVKLTFTDSAGKSVSSTPVNGSGSVDLSTLAEGAISVSYTATDLAGNASSGTAASLTLDRTVAAPLSVALKTDSGVSNSDGKTNVANVVATGTEAGAKVEFSIDNGKTWSTAIAPNEGSVTVIARQTDAAGNVSSSSSPFTFTYDKTAPTAPTLSLAVDSGDSATDRISLYGDLLAAGLEANARVEYSIDGGKTWTSGFTAQEGANNVQAHAIDEAGNTSAASAILSFTLDTTKPVTPSVDLGDNKINRAEQPAFAFTLNGVEAKSTAYVTFFDSNKHSVSKTFTGTGAPINATIDLSELSDGTVSVSAYVVDQAGNVSATAAQSAQLDGITTPTIGLLNDTWAGPGSNGDFVTRDARISVSDAPADLKTREFTVDGVKQVGDYTPLSDGAHTITVTDTDLSGNVASATLSFTLDTQVAKPIVSIYDNGSSNSDGLTNSPWLNVSNLEAGATIAYSLDNGASWLSSYDVSTLPDGAYTARVLVTDLAGNTAISDPVSYQLDRTINAPTLSLTTYMADGKNYQNFTYQINIPDSDIALKTVSFTDRSGHIVYDNDGTANLSGLSDGQITVQAWITDKAGNTSQSTPQYFTLQVFDITDATINANGQLVLTFSRDLDATTLPLADNFRVLINGEAIGFTGLSIAGKTLTLQAGQNLIPEQVYSLSVTYGESNNAGASPDALRAADGTYRSYLSYQDNTVAFTPAIQRISTGTTPDLDIYVGSDTLEVLVQFNTGVVITDGAGGAKPYVTLNYLDANGQSTTLKASFNPWGGSYDGSYPLQTARFTVDLDPAVLSKNGTWKVTGLELNGATIKDYGTKTLSLDTTTFATAAQDFAAGGYYVPHATQLDNGGTQGTSGNDIFVWDDITKMPAGVLSGNFSGVNLSGNTGGDRDFLGVHILVSDTPLSPAVANQYTLRFDPATKVITVYNDSGAAIKTVTVPQGAGWPNGVEGIYYSLAFKDSSQGGAYAQVNDGDTGTFILPSMLAYVDPQRAGDVFVQGSSYADTIDVSASVKLTSNGSVRTTATSDRFAIRGGQGNDTITGHSGSDVIYGDEGSNVINAGAGDDIIGVYADTAGSNTIDGGSGKDLVRISLLGDHGQGAFKTSDGNTFEVGSYQKNYNGGADTEYDTQYTLSADEANGKVLLKTSSGGVSYTNTLSNIEGLQLRFDNKAELSDVSMQVGTNNGERLISKGDGGVIFGMGGDDVIKAIADGDVLFGGSGNDTLIFSGQRGAEISGGDGRDTAVAITTAWGPLSAMAVSGGLPAGVTAAWKIVNQYDTAGSNPYHLVQRLSDGTYNVVTYESAMNVSNGASASTSPTPPVTTTNHLAGVEVLKFEAADGTLFGTFVLDNDLKPISPSMSLSSDGKQLTLTFGTTLDSAVVPPASAFEIESWEGNVPVSGVAVSGATVVLTLSQPLMGGSTTVRYADATTGDDAAKVLQVASSGKDLSAFQVTSNLPAQPAHITSITSGDIRGLGAAAEGDGMAFTVNFSAPVTIKPAADNALPTLSLNLTAPDGSTTQVEATLQYSGPATSTGQQHLTFLTSVSATTVGTFSVAGVNLHGAQIVGAYATGAPPVADLSLSQAILSPAYAFFSHGSHVSSDPLAADAGSAANDLLVFGYDKAAIPDAIVQGNYSGVDAGAGNRDAVVVYVTIHDAVDAGTAGQYELRYNGAGATKYVELWKLGGSAAIEQYVVPDAAHWPVNTELLMFQPVFVDTSGNQQFAESQWLTLSRSTLVYGSGNDYTVHGSMGNDVINVASTLTPTDGSAHAVVNADRIQILGGVGNDTITGHGGTDWINGGSGTNVINAGGGDDFIVLSRDSGNTIDGGAGNDTLLLQVAGGDNVDYGDASGALHLGSRFYSSTTGMVDGADQLTLAYDEANGKITIVDVAHGNQVTTVSNVENISLLFDSYPIADGAVALKVGTSGADNVALTEQGAVYFGGAGNDTIDATGAVWTTLFGGSGDDTFKFTANSDTTLLGGAGNDKGVMVFGSSLSPLQLEHVAGSLDWTVTDTPNHALLNFHYDTAHQAFEIKVAHSADYGFGPGSSYDANTMSISSVETLVLQTARGDTMLSLKIDETNKTVSVLPV
jgi:hypothetical protein